MTRGHLGRQVTRRKRIERDLIRQRAFFDSYATCIQLRFRGFHSRKFLHNFYARKAYVTAVVQKGDEVRSRLAQRLEQQVAEKTGEQERSGRETVNTLATRLHHLRSTASCAGIYNSPYHVGYHPTAFGVPVEEHLRNAVRPVIKKELSERGRTLKPVGSLPPIQPRNMHQASYGEMMQEERQERWLDKTKRMAQEDFVKATGACPSTCRLRPRSHRLSSPRLLERSVDKSRVAEENFRRQCLNRLVDPARPVELGMSEKSRLAMGGSYIPAESSGCSLSARPRGCARGAHGLALTHVQSAALHAT